MSALTCDGRESAAPVGPEDCALCVGIPLTREAVLRCLAAPEEASYVAGIVRGHAVTDDTIDALWPQYQAQVVVPVTALGKRLGDMGVDVRPVAAPEDLVRPARDRRVLLLWTHWEAPPFRAEEITDPDGLVRDAERGATWAGREVREALRPRRWLFGRGDLTKGLARVRAEGRLREYVAAGLNQAIRQARQARQRALGRALRRGPSGAWPGGPTAGPSLARVLVEEWFPGSVTAGKCLELTSGMVTAWQFLQELPSDRWLVLDLTVCNSTELQEVARRPRPRVRVIGHYQEVEPPSGALLVVRTLELLEARRRPYLEARAAAIGQLREELEKPHELGQESS